MRPLRADELRGAVPRLRLLPAAGSGLAPPPPPMPTSSLFAQKFNVGGVNVWAIQNPALLRPMAPCSGPMAALNQFTARTTNSATLGATQISA